MIRSSILSLNLFLIVLSTNINSGFAAFVTTPKFQNGKQYLNLNANIHTQNRHYSQSDVKSKLNMSSLEQDPENDIYSQAEQQWTALQEKVSDFVVSKLPSPPEDQLSFMGDIGSLFLYSFLDHFVNHMYDKMIDSSNIVSTFSSAKAAIETSSSLVTSTDYSGTAVMSSSLPVWFDALSSAPFGNIPLTAALPIEHHITYAPIISSAGVASVLLSSVWIVCGYCSGAFLYRNTIECSSRHAIFVTTKTWFYTCVIMVALAYGSDWCVGCIDGLHKSVGGLTRADADYIFDSLSVLLMWRFLVSMMFGYDDDDSNK